MGQNLTRQQDNAPSPPAAAHGAGPKATPLFHEGKVLTHGVSEILAAFDAATGTRLWKTPPPTEPQYFSAASSPSATRGSSSSIRETTVL
jgi:outer membrane protein assembly factor BamB